MKFSALQFCRLPLRYILRPWEWHCCNRGTDMQCSRPADSRRRYTRCHGKLSTDENRSKSLKGLRLVHEIKTLIIISSRISSVDYLFIFIFLFMLSFLMPVFLRTHSSEVHTP